MIRPLKPCFLIMNESLILWKFIISKGGTQKKHRSNKNRLRIWLNKDSLILFKEAIQ